MPDSKLLLKIHTRWFAKSYASHLNHLAIVYRWHCLFSKQDDDLDFLKQDENKELLKYYLLGHQIQAYATNGETPKDLFASYIKDLEIEKIRYGSPTSEEFTGYIEGLNGIAGLIERMVFWRKTNELKDLEIKERRLAFIERKIGVMEKAEKYLTSRGYSREEIDMLINAYLSGTEEIFDLTEYGRLEKVSISSELSLLHGKSKPTSDDKAQ